MSCFQHRREVFKNWTFDFPVREAKKVSIYMNHSFILVICVGEEEEKRGAFKKYVRSKFPIFDPPPTCSSMFILHCTPFYPSPSTYVRFSELPPSQKKLRNVNEFSNEKPWIKKREKNYFFCKLNIKDQCFLKLYIQ